jgi:hypothetical protein
MRIYGESNFIRKYLCFYHFDPKQSLFNKTIEWVSWLVSMLGLVKKQKNFYDKLIDEIAYFIHLTERIKVHEYLEIYSKDLYGDLVRLLFANRSKFPLLTQLIQDDMQEILKTPETETSKHTQSLY